MAKICDEFTRKLNYIPSNDLFFENPPEEFCPRVT
jgi:hypothetical protein